LFFIGLRGREFGFNFNLFEVHILAFVAAEYLFAPPWLMLLPALLPERRCSGAESCSASEGLVKHIVDLLGIFPPGIAQQERLDDKPHQIEYKYCSKES
jgi:hypothetical protein